MLQRAARKFQPLFATLRQRLWTNQDQPRPWAAARSRSYILIRGAGSPKEAGSLHAIGNATHFCGKVSFTGVLNGLIPSLA